ncbi:MAG: hypothetical protein ABI193_17780 [Minicystis sp.]
MPFLRPRPSLRSAAPLALACLIITVAPRAFAADTRPPPTATAPRLVELRVALSAPAAKRLAEPRLRRLLEIELQDSAVLAPGAGGPLGDDVAYVWIDQPTAAQGVIEVRIGDRAVAHREIGTAGLSGDVAARLVAIAASEMVRAQLEPLEKAPPPAAAPRRPTPEELEKAARAQPTLTLVPGATAAFLPATKGVLGGASLSAGYRFLGVGEALTARWLSGDSDAGALRWLELGLGVDYRLWLGRSFRLALGGSAALASVHLGEVLRVAETDSDHETWSARAGAKIGAELRIAPGTWLGLTVEPGAILRPAPYETRAGKSAVEGAFLGLGLGLGFDLLPAPDLSETRAP